MLELGPLTPAFILLALSEFFLGGYVLLKAPLSPVNRTFFYLTVLAGVGSLLDLLVASIDSGEVVVWVFRLLVFLLVVEMGVAIRLSTMVPYASPIPVFKNVRYYGIALLVLATAITLTVGPMVRDEYGWVPASDLTFGTLCLVMVLYLSSLAVILNGKRKVLKGMLRKQALLFFIALAIPAMVMFALMSMTIIGADVPRMYGVGEVLFVIIMAYGMVRYHVLIPPRVQEKVRAGSSTPRLTRGRAYLLELPSLERMLGSVAQETSEGLPALIICRTHPDQVRSRYGLMQTPFIWLAQSPGPDRVDPSNLQMLTHITTEFVRRGPSMIALEGLEHLLLNNEPNKVLRFLGQLRDEVIVNGSILLVSIDPNTLTERQRAILEREFDIID